MVLILKMVDLEDSEFVFDLLPGLAGVEGLLNLLLEKAEGLADSFLFANIIIIIII